MNGRVVKGSTVLLACFLGSALWLAAGPGTGHTGKSFSGAKTKGVETPRQIEGHDSMKSVSDQFPDDHALGLASAGRALQHAMGSVAGLVRRPSGWDQGKKTGWDGGSMPPGLAKKQTVPSKLVHRVTFFRRGEEVFESQGVTRVQVANFDRFLDLHPGLERSLTQNPSLINNQTFLATQPSLAGWLRAHPATAEELKENPQAFMGRERVFEANEARTAARFPRLEEDGINRQEVAGFDRFLDANPNLAARLSQNPSLINNSAFLAKNPSLATWLNAHPGAAEEIRENPQGFFHLEQGVEATRSEGWEASDDL